MSANDETDQDLIQTAKNLAEKHGIDHDEDAESWGNLEFRIEGYINTYSSSRSKFLDKMYEHGLAPEIIFDDGSIYFRPFEVKTETVEKIVEEEREVLSFK